MTKSERIRAATPSYARKNSSPAKVGNSTLNNAVAKTVRLTTSERLQKLISRAGVASRRDAEDLVST